MAEEDESEGLRVHNDVMIDATSTTVIVVDREMAVELTRRMGTRRAAESRGLFGTVDVQRYDRGRRTAADVSQASTACGDNEPAVG